MRRRRSLALLNLAFALLFVVACGPSPTTSQSGQLPAAPTSAPTAIQVVNSPTIAPPPAEAYEVIRDVSWQKDPDGYAQQMGKLDIYIPKDQANFPVLVWFHGGSLMYQSKEDPWSVNVAKRLASEGIGVVLPDYRLFPKARYPTYVEDAAGAVAWVHDNISSYKGNPEQLFIGGHSSGAYLAAMLGIDERWLKTHQLSLKEIAGVIPLSGEMFGDSTIWQARGLVKAQPLDETAPMFHVRADAPPFLALCAEFREQPTTVCEENQKFIEALRAKGAKDAAFEMILGRDHFTTAEMKSPDDPVAKLMLAFIQKAR